MERTIFIIMRIVYNLYTLLILMFWCLIGWALNP